MIKIYVVMLIKTVVSRHVWAIMYAIIKLNIIQVGKAILKSKSSPLCVPA